MYIMKSVLKSIIPASLLSLGALFASESDQDPSKRDQLEKINPSADMVLHPLEGEVIWSAPERISYGKYLSHGKMTLFPYIEASGLYITQAAICNPNDCYSINMGFKNHTLMKFDSEKVPDELVILDSYNDTCFASIDTYCENLDINTPHFNNKNDILRLLSSAYSVGARRAYASFRINYNDPQNIIYFIQTELPAMRSYYASGFSIIATKDELDDNSTTVLFMKNLTAKDLITTIGYEWQLNENDPYLLEEYHGKFGLYLRNNEGAPQGGLLGSFFQGRQKLSCAEIDLFYTGPDVRGSGYGKMLMTYAESFLKSKGVEVITLATTGYQAPWFYEKFGYNCTFVIPKISRWKGGLTDAYFYEKRL